MKITFTKGFSIPIAPFNNAPMSITIEGDEGQSFEDLNAEIDKTLESNYERLFHEQVRCYEKVNVIDKNGTVVPAFRLNKEEKIPPEDNSIPF